MPFYRWERCVENALFKNRRPAVPKTRPEQCTCVITCQHSDCMPGFSSTPMRSRMKRGDARADVAAACDDLYFLQMSRGISPRASSSASASESGRRPSGGRRAAAATRRFSSGSDDEATYRRPPAVLTCPRNTSDESSYSATYRRYVLALRISPRRHPIWHHHHHHRGAERLSAGSAAMRDDKPRRFFTPAENARSIKPLQFHYGCVASASCADNDASAL